MPTLALHGDCYGHRAPEELLGAHHKYAFLAFDVGISRVLDFHSSQKSGLAMRYGYARVSSKAHDYQAQVEALKAVGCERIFSEKQSGGHPPPCRDRAEEEVTRQPKSALELEKIVADFIGFDQKVIMVERVGDKGDFRVIVTGPTAWRRDRHPGQEQHVRDAHRGPVAA